MVYVRPSRPITDSDYVVVGKMKLTAVNSCNIMSRKLIIVCCHGVYVGSHHEALGRKAAGIDDKDW